MYSTYTSMGPTQELAQKVCERYGWSFVIEKQGDDGFWTCTVTVGLNNRRSFVSNDNRSPDDTIAGRKQGTAAASQAALDGLQQEIARQEAKPVKELGQVFSEPIDIYESNRKNWDYFWKHKPSVVGIDTEGNNISPPVIVQISTDDYTIIEVPNKVISRDLTRLLEDETIVKVFCDNYSHRDKKCLGMTEMIPADLTAGHIIDLEAVATKWLGSTKVARGLSRIVALCMPELDQVQIRKPAGTGRLKSVGRFAWIEQGKAPPLKALRDLSEKEQHYAALDAWCTLQAYKRLCEAVSSFS